MSSTDQKQHAALVRFYEENLGPLARAHGMEFLDHGPAPGAASYFLTRPRPRMSRSDFVLKLGEEKQAAQTLEDHWVQTPLRGLGRRLLRLTRSFVPKVGPKSELSAAIYEMF
jgi:hypothetical protein